MTCHPDLHHRRSIRLQGYNYSQAGAYFVTLCTKGRECLLDDRVVSGIVLDVWRALPGWFPTIELDEFVVMPNHIHFIVWLFPPDDTDGTTPAPAPNTGNTVGATLPVSAAAQRRAARRCGCPQPGRPQHLYRIDHPSARCGDFAPGIG